MKLGMHPNSLFAVLLRSPWWLSFAVAAAVVALLRLVLPGVYAFFAAIPFLVISAIAAWRQLRAPSPAKVAALHTQSWDEFAAALEAAFRREGYSVSRLDGRQADLELERAGRTVLVACKRWKVARTGIAPLRELYAARRKREAAECIYIAVGDVTENAVAFSTEHGIRLMRGAELASFLRL